MAHADKRGDEGFIATRIRSFTHAFRGLRRLLRETNARLHALATVVVVWVGYFLHLTPLEWGSLVFAIALVLSAEAFNTALETLADAAVPDRHPLVGEAKDLAAAGVLLAAFGAVAIAVLIGPHLWDLGQKLR